jgi:hypothetical protein
MEFIAFLMAMYVHSLGYGWGTIVLGYGAFLSLLFLAIWISCEF